MEATYLLNSGFLIRVGEILLVFDAFDDPAGVLPKEIGAHGDAPLYFFASHAHFDHFNPMIADFSAHTTRYILSEDIRENAGAARIPQDKTTWIGCYDAWKDECISVTSFSSTDEGTSFLVEVDGKRIFHAGDFNWWDWTGDTEVNRKFAENGFRKGVSGHPWNAVRRCSALRRIRVCSLRCIPLDIPHGSPPQISLPRGEKFLCGRPARRGSGINFPILVEI